MSWMKNQLLNAISICIVFHLSVALGINGDHEESEKSFEFNFDFLKPESENAEINTTSDDLNYDLLSSLNVTDKLVNSSINDDHIISDLNHQSKLFELPLNDQSSVNHQNEKINLNYEVYVRKCCKKDEAFLISKGSCAKYDVDFVVPTYITLQGIYTNLTIDQMNLHEGLLTSCAPSILEIDEFYLFDSGDLFATILEKFFRPDHYCLETMVDDGEETISSKLTAAYCPLPESLSTFDPNKIPVRKCCRQSELVPSDTTSECSHRTEFTTQEWTVPTQSDHYVSSFSKNFTDVYEIVSGYPECVMDERGESMGSNWDFHLLQENGYLNVPTLGFSTHNYCIDEYFNDLNQSSPFAYVCLSPPEHRKFTQFKPHCQAESEFCVQKCCPAGQILDEEAHCIPDPFFHLVPQSVPVYYPNGSVLHLQDIDYNFGNGLCGSRGFFTTREEERAQILFNGSLRYLSFDSLECDPLMAEIIPSQDYCYERILFSAGNGPDEIGPKIIEGALICYPENHMSETEHAKQINYIYSIFLAISDVFILISIIIYLTVPDQTKRGLNKNIKLGHSILGRILVSFLFSMFFLYLFLIISKTASESINLANHSACTALGVAIYISVLATFFWLNVLCFELWWKCARQERTSGRRWFWYQVYGWGNPVILGSVVLFIEFSPSIGSCFVKPNFGTKSCFFSDTKTFGSAAKWVYLNGPISLLLVTDLVFFLLTVKSLLITVQQSHKSTVKRQARQRLKLCFKLFLVMGICWLTEIISVAANAHNWYLTEVFNCLQGFVIFLIFILKPKIMGAVKEKICVTCCHKQPTQQPMRGRLTFTSSVLSDFLSSTKRNRTSREFSTSTSTSSLSWSSSISDSPTSSLPRKINPFVSANDIS